MPMLADARGGGSQECRRRQFLISSRDKLKVTLSALQKKKSEFYLVATRDITCIRWLLTDFEVAVGRLKVS